MRAKPPFDPTIPLSPAVVLGAFIGVILVASVVLWLVAPQRPAPDGEPYGAIAPEAGESDSVALPKSHKGTTVKRVKTITIKPGDGMQ